MTIERASIFEMTEQLVSRRQEQEAPAAAAPEADAPEEILTGEGPDLEPEQGAPVIETHEGEDEPEETPASVDMPNSWPQDRLEEWQGLSPSVQELILNRERDAQRAVSEKGREASETLRKAQEAEERARTEYAERAKRLDDILPKLVDRLQDKWSKVDWKKLAEEDPEDYVRKQAELNEDQRLLNAAAQDKFQRRQVYQSEQFKLLTDPARNPQYAGDEGKKRLAMEAEKVERHLRNLGYSEDMLQELSAEAFETVRDGLAHRDAKATAAKPAKQGAQRTAKPSARPAPVDQKVKKYSAKVEQLNAIRKAGGGLNAQLRAAAEARLASRGT